MSPDGRWIVFRSGRSTQPGMDVHPRWSPDGEWLVITTDRWGWSDELDFVSMNFQPYGELAALRVADGHVVRLTHNNWEEAQGTWVPVGLDAILGPTGSRTRRAPPASTADRR